MQTLRFLRNISRIRPLLRIVNLVSFVKAAQIKAAFELGRRQDLEPDVGQYSINDPARLVKALRKGIQEKAKERFKLVLLNTRNKIIGISTISVGTLNASLVHPREVFKDALTHSASSIILVHNHPSDDPEPSDDDLVVTRRLVDAGRLMGVRGARSYYHHPERLHEPQGKRPAVTLSGEENRRMMRMNVVCKRKKEGAVAAAQAIIDRYGPSIEIALDEECARQIGHIKAFELEHVADDTDLIVVRRHPALGCPPGKGERRAHPRGQPGGPRLPHGDNPRRAAGNADPCLRGRLPHLDQGDARCGGEERGGGDFCPFSPQ